MCFFHFKNLICKILDGICSEEFGFIQVKKGSAALCSKMLLVTLPGSRFIEYKGVGVPFLARTLRCKASL